MTLGRWLRSYRVHHCLTQQKITDRTGLGQSHVSELENDIGDTQPSTVQRYGTALGRTLLIELVESPPETAGELELIPRPGHAEAYTSHTLNYLAGMGNVVRRSTNP